MDEIYALCDRVTILRDGRRVDTRALQGLDRLDLVCAMLGRAGPGGSRRGEEEVPGIDIPNGI